MLVVTRKLNEKILIGQDIEVTVVRIGEGQVRLGITAPLHLSILREELAGSSAKESAGPK